MDYEKKYKEALERANKYLYDTNKRMSTEFFEATERAMKEIFPELKDSEDEKIRNTIFDCLYKCCDSGVITREQRYICIAWLEKQSKQKSTKEKEWTIEDAKDGDVLTFYNKECPFIYRTKTFFGNPVAYCGVRSDGTFISSSPIDHQWCLKSEVVPATKEQRDLLFAKMKEVGYEWDAENKKLKKVGQE